MLNKRQIRRILTRTLFPFLTHTRSYRITQPVYSGIGSILMFHRVVLEEDGSELTGMDVSLDYLKGVIELVEKKGYEIVSLDDVFRILKGEKQIDRRFAAFTFDDGYMDNYTLVYPLFKRLGIPFAIYVTTGMPDGNVVMWWYLLGELLRKRDSVAFETNGKRVKFDCSTWGKKKDALFHIRNLIMSLDQEQFLPGIRAIFEPHQVDLYEKTRRESLSWEQIRELSDDPLVTIGAHTNSHAPLSRLPASRAKQEILESKKRIEAETGKSVDHFAYPYGSVGEVGHREFRMARACGFKTTGIVQMQNIFPAHRDSLECLPRIPMSQYEMPDVRLLNLFLGGLLPCLLNRFRKPHGPMGPLSTGEDAAPREAR